MEARKNLARNSQLPAPDSYRPCWPTTLAHERKQMLQRFLVAAVLFGGKLAGALVKLRGHVGGFFRRAAERDEDLREFGNFHG
jgi:hypothetical protein